MRLLIGLLVCALLPGCNGGERPAEAEEKKKGDADAMEIPSGSPHLRFLKMETVAPTDLGGKVTLTGKVTYDENHTQRMASPVDGRATRVVAELGDEVKVGQTLVELSSPNVGQLHGDVVKAQQDVALAEKTLERAKRLLGDGAISQKEVSQAETDYAKAKADLNSASGRLGSLNLASSGGMAAGLRSQIAGTVVERSVLVGQEVRQDQAQPLITISDLSTVWVSADVFEQDLSLVRDGAAVVITVSAYPGVEFPGKVGNVSHVVDPTTHTVKVRCIVQNPDKKLKPEMFARIVVKDADGQQLTVSAKAILAETQPPKVLVVEGTHYTLRDVQVGPEVGGRVRILSGLKPGEQIVTEGAIFLKQEIETQ